ncbi:MAG: peptide-methionine (R)-S-oxide reductase, partial [Rhizobium giardinii]
MTRRGFFLLSGTAVLAAAAFRGFTRNSVASETGETFEVTKTDAEWKAILTDEQYRILRHEDTERPFTSALNTEKRKGIFHCAGCDLPVYSSEAK